MLFLLNRDDVSVKHHLLPDERRVEIFPGNVC